MRKGTLLLFLAFACSFGISHVFAESLSHGHKALMTRFMSGLNEAMSKGLITEFENWSDIEKLPIEMQAQMLGSYSPNYQNLSDFFVIIPVEDRFDVEEGQLIIVSATPVDLTAWYKNYLEKDPKLNSEKLKNYDTENPTSKEVRWGAVASKDGDLKTVTFNEKEFQNYVSENNLTIPKPTTYRFNIAQLNGGETLAKDSEQSETKTTSSATQKQLGEVATTSTKDAIEPTASFPWLFVIVGIILLAVIAVVGFKVLGKSS